jgi:hypothetical protein
MIAAKDDVHLVNSAIEIAFRRYHRAPSTEEVIKVINELLELKYSAA